ncbi:MAG: anthranilate synthase component I family protein [Desulfobacterales bacterium]|nr:anthranilate synthase component I family protein [Desulfobacterales bacterium]
MLLSQFPDPSAFLELSRTHNVIPACVEILADTETPVSLMGKICRHEPSVFLFESVEGGERWGRYSFLGVSARYHIRIFPQFVEIEQNRAKTKLRHNGDPIAVVRDFMHRYNPASVKGLPRFWGGLVGYLTYEMVSFFEAIPNKLPEGKPLAHFIMPDKLIIFDNIRHTLLAVIICFLEDDTDPRQAHQMALEHMNELIRMINRPLEAEKYSAKSSSLLLTAPVPDRTFRSSVNIVKEHIRAGDVIQTVISQPFVCSPAPDPWTLYRAQRYINPSPYLYFLHLDDVFLVGSSPETMVRLENGIATLRPIAGTRPRGKTEQEDRQLAHELLTDEKERAEHLMLVDLGRNDLGRVAETGSVQVTDLMIVERYSHVMHLVSNIRCDLMPDYDAWDLLRATFPAGTLSGAPKVRAMEIIAELETDPRGPYGGAVGYISFNGNMDLAITIRTACIENGRLVVQAGAGIVADSDPERERCESVNKAMAIQKALQLIENQG